MIPQNDAIGGNSLTGQHTHELVRFDKLQIDQRLFRLPIRGERREAGLGRQQLLQRPQRLGGLVLAGRLQPASQREERHRPDEDDLQRPVEGLRLPDFRVERTVGVERRGPGPATRRPGVPPGGQRGTDEWLDFTKTYGRERAETFRAQTARPFRLVMVDNASTDGSAEIESAILMAWASTRIVST